MHSFLPTSMTVTKKKLVVAGLPVTVYSSKSGAEKTDPVAVMFFLHGRTGTAKSIAWVAEDALKQVESKKRKHEKSSLDLIIVTFVSLLFYFRCKRG